MSTIIDGSAGITFPNSTVQASAGQVLQVVNATTSTSVSNSTTTLADTTLTATITPKFSTSKILVLVSQSGVYKSSGNANSCVNIKLLRNSTVIDFFAFGVGYTGTSLDLITSSASTCYLDSPATTSATTYKTQFANYVNASAVQVQSNGETSTITLMEIAG